VAYTYNKILIKSKSKLAEINKEVCQGCPLLPTLFKIYLDEIITKWQKEEINGIPLFKKSATNKCCYLQMTKL